MTRKDAALSRMVGSKVVARDARREQSGDVRLRPRLPPGFADPNPSKPHHSHDYRKLALPRLITLHLSQGFYQSSRYPSLSSLMQGHVCY